MTPYIFDSAGRIIALAADNVIPQRAAGVWDKNFDARKQIEVKSNAGGR